jgi:outer membrane usher protein
VFFHSSNRFASARGDYQNNYGTYSLGASKESSTTSYQAQARGSVVYLDGYLGFSRTINDSFALVKTPGLSGVPVYWENQKVGVTNKHGDAFIPNLISYNKNNVSLDPGSLPLGMQIKSVHDDIIPYYRSGNVVKFGIHKVSSGMLTIKLASGKYIPLTSTVFSLDTKKTYPVGYDGKIFISNVEPKISLLVDIKGKQCKINVSANKNSKEAVQNLGTYICNAK